MIRIPSVCTGCYACAAICPKKCIDMKDIGEGFFISGHSYGNLYSM